MSETLLTEDYPILRHDSLEDSPTDHPPWQVGKDQRGRHLQLYDENYSSHRLSQSGQHEPGER